MAGANSTLPYSDPMALLTSFVTLLLFQLAGELLHQALHLPLPGPVLGMALLALWLSRPSGGKETISPSLASTADGLLSILGLLFVPAGVGIVANLDVIRQEWLPITLSLVVSTLLTLVVTAWVMHAMIRPQRPRSA